MMTPALETAAEQFGPWNPGIESPIPRSLRHFATIFRPDNVYTSYGAAEEIAGLTGLAMREVVVVRPRPPSLHAVLVRLTPGFSVPDGQKIEDLGINFREIARAILATYVEPEMAAITSAYDALRRQLADQVRAETRDLLTG